MAPVAIMAPPSTTDSAPTTGQSPSSSYAARRSPPLLPTSITATPTSMPPHHHQPPGVPPSASMPDLGPANPTYSFREHMPNATIRYITDLAAADAALAELDLQGPLGFDLEWRPTFIKGAPENPVALVQLADAATECVLLFQVSAMPNFPANLADVLGNPSIIKTGVGIQNDALKLNRDWGVATRGCVDLSLLARSVDAQWKGRYANSLGLARLVEMYKHRTLAKGKRIQMSDWSKLLNPIQQEYAANDAHASLALYQHLFSLAQRKIPVPKPIYYTFWCEDNSLLVPDGAEGECPPPPLAPIDETAITSSSSTSSSSSSAPSSVVGPETPMGSPDFSASWPAAEPVRALWHPYNPEYDPGPPPPPRPPKPPVLPDDGELEMSFDMGSPAGVAPNAPRSGNNNNGRGRGRRGSHFRRQSGGGRATPFFSNALPIHPRANGRPHLAHAPASAPAATTTPLSSSPGSGGSNGAGRGRGPRGRWSPAPAFVPGHQHQPHHHQQQHGHHQQYAHGQHRQNQHAAPPPPRPWTPKLTSGGARGGQRLDAVRAPVTS